MSPTRRSFVLSTAQAAILAAVHAELAEAAAKDGGEAASSGRPESGRPQNQPQPGSPPVRISLSSFDARAHGSLLLGSDGSVWLREFDDDGRQCGLRPLFAADELMTPGAALRALLAATTVS